MNTNVVLTMNDIIIYCKKMFYSISLKMLDSRKFSMERIFSHPNINFEDLLDYHCTCMYYNKELILKTGV